jgi:hypothetical protein
MLPQDQREQYDLQEKIYYDLQIIGFTDGVFNMSPEMPEDPEYMAGYHDGQRRYYNDMFAAWNGLHICKTSKTS